MSKLTLTVKVAWNLPLCCKFLGKDLLSFRGQGGLEQSSQALTSPPMSTSSPSWCLTMMGRGTAGTATTQKSTWKSLRNTPKLTWWASSLLFYFAREDPRLSNLARLSFPSLGALCLQQHGYFSGEDSVMPCLAAVSLSLSHETGSLCMVLAVLKLTVSTRLVSS